MRNRIQNRGEIVEDIMNGAPIDYLHGSGSILPVLETSIEGLKAGDEKSLVFSDPNLDGGENYHIDVVIDHIREATAAELQMGRPEPKAADTPCGPGVLLLSFCNCQALLFDRLSKSSILPKL